MVRSGRCSIRATVVENVFSELRWTIPIYTRHVHTRQGFLNHLP